MSDVGGEDHLVLVAEDEALIRDMLEAALEEIGCRVLVAGTGDAALQMVAAGARPDLVVTDIRMPGALDGLAFVRCAVGVLPELKVLYISGHVAELDAERDAGVVRGARFLGKPFKLARFQEIVRDLLAP